MLALFLVVSATIRWSFCISFSPSSISDQKNDRILIVFPRWPTLFCRRGLWRCWPEISGGFWRGAAGLPPCQYFCHCSKHSAYHPHLHHYSHPFHPHPHPHNYNPKVLFITCSETEEYDPPTTPRTGPVLLYLYFGFSPGEYKCKHCQVLWLIQHSIQLW